MDLKKITLERYSVEYMSDVIEGECKKKFFRIYKKNYLVAQSFILF